MQQKTVSLLGKNIKEARKLKNLSGHLLAKKSGIGASTISQIETGKRQTLNTDTIKKIAETLNIPVNDLLNNSNDEPLFSNNVDIGFFVNSLSGAKEVLLNGLSLEQNEILQFKELVKTFEKMIKLQRNK